jgi:hypothetical protein
VRAGHLLAVDVPAAASGLAKLLKLRVKGLPVGGNAGIADEPFFGLVSVISYANRDPLMRLAQAKCAKVLIFATMWNSWIRSTSGRKGAN